MGAALGGGAGGGGRRRRRRKVAGAPMGEINVTPFVDVMLVLLIIFMVAAPLLTVGVPVDLPESRADPLPTEQKPPVSVVVDPQGLIYVGDDPVDLETLAARVAEAVDDPETEAVYIRADGEAAYRHVADVMGALNAGGFRRLSFVTAPRNE